MFSLTMAPSGQPAATAARRRTTVPGSAAIAASIRNSVGVSRCSRSPCRTAYRSGSRCRPRDLGRGPVGVRRCSASMRTITSESANGFAT